MLNPYLVLGIRPGASPDELRSAYRDRARETHPDHGGDADSFAEVREAYEVLRDEQRRTAWESTYRQKASALGATICECCFTAQKRTSDLCCRVCGEAWPVEPKKESVRLPPRLDRLRQDLLDRLGETAIDMGARIGDEIASATVEGVHRGLEVLASKLGRSGARRR